jgi:hypothetical protein
MLVLVELLFVIVVSVFPTSLLEELPVMVWVGVLLKKSEILG